MAWVVRPPEEVKSGEMFSVTYSVTAQDSFYEWAVEKNIFTHRYHTLGFMDQTPEPGSDPGLLCLLVQFHS